MSHSKVRVFLHIVWATKGRTPWLQPGLESLVHRKVREACLNLNCQPFSINGTADHVHLICALRSTVEIAQLICRAKAVSSSAVRRAGLQAFEWQKGYGAFSVSPHMLETANHYVDRQKEHHRCQTILASHEILEGNSEEEQAFFGAITPGVQRR